MADDPAVVDPPQDPPVDPGSTEPDLEAILKDAQNPDAVRNAIKRRTDEASAAKKRAAELETKLKEIEDRDLSEKEKAEKTAAEARKEADDAKAELLRLRVAADKKVPSDLADLLKGDTKEELEASAERLLKHVGGGSGGQLDGGTRGSAAQPDDMDSMIRHQAGYR